MFKKKNFLLLLLVLCLFFVIPAEAKTVNPKLNNTNPYLVNGEVYPLKVIGYSGRVQYRSSNRKVITIDSKGKMTAHKAGKSTITVKVKGTVLKSTVTVMDFAQKNVSLKMGSSMKLKVTNGKDVILTSSNPSIVSVKNNEIIAKKKGTAVITAKTRNKILRCHVNVPNVTFSTTEMLASGVFSTAVISTEYAKGKPIYRSSNKRVISVDSSGKLKAKSTGVASITVLVDGIRYVKKIVVSKPSADLFVDLLKQYNTYLKNHAQAFRNDPTPESSFEKASAIVEKFEKGLSTKKARMNCNAGIRWAFNAFGFNYSTIYAVKGSFGSTYKGDMCKYTYRISKKDKAKDRRGKTGYDALGLTYEEAIKRKLLKKGDIVAFEGLTHVACFSGNGTLFFDGGGAALNLGGYGKVGMLLNYNDVPYYHNKVISQIIRWK